MKDSFLGTLAPFAPDMDDEMAAFLQTWLAPERVTASGRDEAAVLLARLLSHAPQELRQAYQDRWLAALRGLVERGATGQGTLGEHAVDLGRPTAQILQDNLVDLLERPRRKRPNGMVAWVAQTIRDGRAAPLADVEEKLIECIDGEDVDLALMALEQVVALLQEVPDFASRNCSRLRRARRSAERRGTFRPRAASLSCSRNFRPACDFCIHPPTKRRSAVRSFFGRDERRICLPARETVPHSYALVNMNSPSS